jgi:transcriptional regulator GlxA family with amidase domain
MREGAKMFGVVEPHKIGKDRQKLEADGKRDLREVELMDIVAWMEAARAGRLGWEGTKPEAYLSRMDRLVAMLRGSP